MKTGVFAEMGDLHSENPEIYPIEAVIKRLRIWLSGRIPKDSLEVELFHHFPNRTYEIQYLLPDLFFDEEIVKGKFYAGMTDLHPGGDAVAALREPAQLKNMLLMTRG